MRSGSVLLLLVLVVLPWSETIAALDGAIESCAGIETESDRANCLDRRGQALSALGRYDEAAVSFAEALALDDGARRLTWVTPGSDARWTAGLDTGEQRLERAARNLLASSRPEAAAEPLGRALALGAGGELEQAWSTLAQGAPPGRQATPTPLRARDWFKPVPDLDVRLFDDTVYSLVDDGRGSVVVLSFWATWCEPCVRELPGLQALFDAERDRGLEVLALNVGESAEVALPFARVLELNLPLGIADKPLRNAFEVSSLPVVALVDRQGRVRSRWDGYRPGLEEQIVAQTLELLSEKDPPATEVAAVLFGGERLRVEWMREAPALVEGLAILPRAVRSGSLLVGAGRSLLLYDRLGQTVRTIKSPVSAGELRVSPAADGGDFEALSFRPGSRDLLSIRFPDEIFEEWSVDAPVFDVACLPSTGTDPTPSFLLATLDGLFRSGRGERAASAVGTIGAGTNSVVSLGVRSAAQAAVLDLEGRIRWIDERGEATAESQGQGETWSLVGGAATGMGVGAAPPGVTAAVVGRFLDEDEPQAALATDAGQLLILGTESGRTLLRVRWEGISALAAGNLLADERDELVVAAGRRVAVLTGTEPRSSK